MYTFMAILGLLPTTGSEILTFILTSIQLFQKSKLASFN